MVFCAIAAHVCLCMNSICMAFQVSSLDTMQNAPTYLASLDTKLRKSSDDSYLDDDDPLRKSFWGSGGVWYMHPQQAGLQQ